MESRAWFHLHHGFFVLSNRSKLWLVQSDSQTVSFVGSSPALTADVPFTWYLFTLLLCPIVRLLGAEQKASGSQGLTALSDAWGPGVPFLAPRGHHSHQRPQRRQRTPEGREGTRATFCFRNLEPILPPKFGGVLDLLFLPDHH